MDIIWIIIRQWQSGQNRSDRNYDKHGFGGSFDEKDKYVFDKKNIMCNSLHSTE